MGYWANDRKVPEKDVRELVFAVLTLENGERILVGARSQYAFMLPWVITRNGKFIQTWNANIARAVVQLIPPEFVDFANLQDWKLRWDVVWFVNKYNERALNRVRKR